jgi:hypothetical protein
MNNYVFITFDDYHEIVYLGENLKNFIPDIQWVEVDYKLNLELGTISHDSYVGMFWTGEFDKAQALKGLERCKKKVNMYSISDYCKNVDKFIKKNKKNYEKDQIEDLKSLSSALRENDWKKVKANPFFENEVSDIFDETFMDMVLE